MTDVQGRYFGPALYAPDEHASLNVDRSFPCSRSASGSIYPNSSTSQSDVSNLSLNYLPQAFSLMVPKGYDKDLKFRSCSTGDIRSPEGSLESFEETTV